MTSPRFLEVHKLTAEFEGGWSNHKADPGGKTMYGVTERVYHAWLKKNGKSKKPVRGITIAEAHEIYFEEYWLKAKCDTLNRGVDRMVYDAAVNSGVTRSRQWLLKSIGSDDDAVTIKNLHSIRMAFLKRLGTWKTFGKGWSRRINAMKKAALEEVISVPDSVSEIPDQSPEKPAKRSLWAVLASLLLKIFKRKSS